MAGKKKQKRLVANDNWSVYKTPEHQWASILSNHPFQLSSSSSSSHGSYISLKLIDSLFCQISKDGAQRKTAYPTIANMRYVPCTSWKINNCGFQRILVIHTSYNLFYNSSISRVTFISLVDLRIYQLGNQCESDKMHSNSHLQKVF